MQYRYFNPEVPTAVHTSGSQQQATNTQLDDSNWYFDALLPYMKQYHKGPLVYTRSNISGVASKDENTIWAIYDNGVYDLTVR